MSKSNSEVFLTPGHAAFDFILSLFDATPATFIKRVSVAMFDGMVTSNVYINSLVGFGE